MLTPPGTVSVRVKITGALNYNGVARLACKLQTCLRCLPMHADFVVGLLFLYHPNRWRSCMTCLVSNLDFKVKITLRYWSYTRPTQQCHFV